MICRRSGNMIRVVRVFLVIAEQVVLGAPEYTNRREDDRGIQTLLG